MTGLQDTANRWLADGIAVIPVAYRDKRPALASWREFQQRLPTLDEIRRWFASRLTNLAIVTGWKGLTVLDFDRREMYQLWRDWARDNAPAARFSYTVETARGVHVYLFVDEPVQTARAGLLDIKAAGGYVLAPPSIHPSGRPYRLLSDAPPVRVPALAHVLPAGLLTLARPVGPTARVAPLPPDADAWATAWQPVARSGSHGSRIEAALEGRSLLELFPDARPRGEKWVAGCPLHDDRNPSVTIDHDGRHARCWAGCLSGDYLDWYGAHHGLTLSQALEALEALGA